MKKNYRYTSTIVVLLLAMICYYGGAFAAGRVDWPGYVWQKGGFSYCPGAPNPSNEWCEPVVNTEWDAGRSQHINFFYRVNDNTGRIRMLFKLQNHHVTDGDTICFTALFTDADGKDVFVFHQRWGINARFASSNPKVRQQIFENELPPSAWKHVKEISLGYRQCQKRDDKLIAQAAITAATVVCTVYTGAGPACAKAGSAAMAVVEGRDTHLGGDDDDD